jgi:hypothetical protein
MTEPEWRENAATVAGRHVVAALEARDFERLATLFADDYVEVIQRNADTPIPRAEMLRGIQQLVEHAGGALTIDPVATLGDRFQLHHTRITVPAGDGDPLVIDYASVVTMASEHQLLRTEAFEVDRLDDAFARLAELGAAASLDAPPAIDRDALARIEALRA